MKGILIKENGQTGHIEPKNGTDFTLEELQDAVGGMIDIIRLSQGKIFVINDEGKFMFGRNNVATIMAKVDRAIFPDDYIAGDVILCDSEMVK